MRQLVERWADVMTSCCVWLAGSAEHMRQLVERWADVMTSCCVLLAGSAEHMRQLVERWADVMTKRTKQLHVDKQEELDASMRSIQGSVAKLKSTEQSARDKLRAVGSQVLYKRGESSVSQVLYKRGKSLVMQVAKAKCEFCLASALQPGSEYGQAGATHTCENLVILLHIVVRLMTLQPFC